MKKITDQLSYRAAYKTCHTGKEIEEHARAGEDLYCYGSPSQSPGICSIRDIEPETKMELRFGSFHTKLKVITL